MNLLETLQQHLSNTPLQKIDPNTQEVNQPQTTAEAMMQAGTTVILTGLYKFSRTDAGAETIIRGETSTNWVQTIFADNQEEVVSRIAGYVRQHPGSIETNLQVIADKAIAIIRNTVSPGNKINDVKDLMNQQINNVLIHLPAVLQIGELLNDDTLDDRTHKMEGPLSSLMQTIGSGFSYADKSEKK